MMFDPSSNALAEFPLIGAMLGDSEFGPLAGAMVTLLIGLTTFGLLRFVRRLPGGSLSDPSPHCSDAERARKDQRPSVPIVGGFALLLGAILVGATGRDAGFEALGLPWPGTLACTVALGLAFGVGLLDDLLPNGLSPGRKFLGQCIAGLPLGLGLLNSGALPDSLSSPVLLLALAALASALALNAINTFDNADGAATGLATLGMAFASPITACVLLGFLPFNLRANSRVPRAYLGDSGSHLLGMWILLTPAAWPILVLPLLDLARLSIERLQRGSRPWHGDREHLAHLFAARGFSSLTVVCALLVIAAPSIDLGYRGLELTRLGLILEGVGWTGLAYFISLFCVKFRAAPAASVLPAQSDTSSPR